MMKKTLFILGLFIATSCCGQQNFYRTHSQFGGYGYLYNSYVARGVGDTAVYNTGWHVPTQANFVTLSTYLGGDVISGGKMKEVGYRYWKSPNTNATNSSHFNGVGSGARGVAGTFGNLSLYSSFWPSALGYRPFLDYSDGNWDQYYSSAMITYGYSIRLIKTTTSLSNGQRGTYIGNDGTVYPTICIGTQEWLARNLYETKYADGTTIPHEGANTGYYTNVEWGALTTGARCVYNNEERYK